MSRHSLLEINDINDIMNFIALRCHLKTNLAAYYDVSEIYSGRIFKSTDRSAQDRFDSMSSRVIECIRINAILLFSRNKFNCSKSPPLAYYLSRDQKLVSLFTLLAYMQPLSHFNLLFILCSLYPFCFMVNFYLRKLTKLGLQCNLNRIAEFKVKCI